MPLNILKKYNELLDIDSLNESARKKSLIGILTRDFINTCVYFRGKSIEPTPKDGKTTMDVLFSHLITKTEESNKEKHREYDRDRAVRLHWINHHINEKSPNNISVFSVQDAKEIRTYIFDEQESYVIILEPKRNQNSYYLITAYYLRGKNIEKIKSKKKRKLSQIY
ncbi:hypothetical protein EZS27_009378 [termite gut metagenome]|uniref:Phage-Barnase-EndoU-ColicinE5/D-RelE like nuclease 3 domain-containing protein n=1 Tax=termite gut metagenome TaxID=433724 RepID=A0A5J4SAJ0_9ZZZZ